MKASKINGEQTFTTLLVITFIHVIGLNSSQTNKQIETNALKHRILWEET